MGSIQLLTHCLVRWNVAETVERDTTAETNQILWFQQQVPKYSRDVLSLKYFHMGTEA
jgi:hypothetical protein